jgi:tetratricopeptide (TPR) repeat protein
MHCITIDSGDVIGRKEVRSDFASPSMILISQLDDPSHLARAFEEFGKAARLDTTLGEAFTYLGHYLREKGDHKRAQKCYEKAVSLDILDSDAGQHLSQYYYDSNDTSSAVNLLKSVTKANTKYAWAWKRLGFWNLVRE